MRLPTRDDGAQSLGYATVFAALIVSALLYIFFQTPINRIQSRRDNATANVSSDVRREALQRSGGFIDLLLNNYLIIVMALAFFGLIVFTVFLRRAGP